MDFILRIKSVLASRTVFTFLIFIFSRSQLHGQVPIFQSYRLPDKIEALEVNKIMQDKSGFIWLATNQGLYKFDGINYWNMSNKLPDENVTSLAQDSVGNIWVGLRNGKISVISKQTTTDFKPEEGLPSVEISDILFDSKGALWFSTHGDGIYYYLNERLYRLDDIDGMPDLYAYDLEEDEQGKIWVGTDGGIAVCSRSGNTVEIRVINYSSGLPDNIIRKISKGKEKTMLVATEDSGVVVFDLASDKVRQILAEKWKHGSVEDLLMRDDWIWISTSSGLATIDLSARSPSLKIQTSDRVKTLCTDAEGGIWIGSKTGIQRTGGKHLLVYEPPDDKNIVAVTVDLKNDIWFATSRGLFKKISKNETQVLTLPLLNTPFSNKKVISLFTDQEGFVWAGFYGEGVIRINPQNGELKSFRGQLLNGNVVNISGKNKSVWLATLGGASEITTDRHFSVKNYSQAQGLATDYLYQVLTDSQNRIWFATDRDGVDRLDESGFHHFKENLSNKVVVSLAEDSNHQVWANVQNEGLYVFDGKKFSSSEVQNHLHSNNFSSLTSERNGQLIAVHQAGIDIFDPIKNNFHYLFKGSILHHAVPNLNAVAIDNESNILVGTSSGLLILCDPLEKNQHFPRPQIDQVEVNGLPADETVLNELSYDQNYIKISFTGFWYQNPSSLSFSYQLENFDHDWIKTDNRSVTFSKLPPGKYFFKLKASDSNDFSNSAVTEIHFVVNPPFWNTGLFYLLSVTLIIFSTYFLIHYRERKLVRGKLALEAKVTLRTLEIHQKSMEIKSQAEEIKLINENLENIVKERTSELERQNKALEEYAFINAHKLRAPVARILGLIHLMKKLKTTDEEKVYMDHLHQSTEELDSVVRTITQAIESGSTPKL